MVSDDVQAVATNIGGGDGCPIQCIYEVDKRKSIYNSNLTKTP